VDRPPQHRGLELRHRLRDTPLRIDRGGDSGIGRAQEPRLRGAHLRDLPVLVRRDRVADPASLLTFTSRVASGNASCSAPNTSS
jgi:hypothetical protein